MRLLVLLVFLLNLFIVSQIYAQEQISTDSALVQKEQTPDYELPYPGILPDNPFYTLKTIRDRIVGFLISDPLKKAQFDLLQADKRLSAGWYLFEKDRTKESLAFSTISKGENYFEEGLQKVQEAGREGIATREIQGTFKKAAKKHRAMVEAFWQKAKSKDQWSSLQKRLERVQKMVDSFSPQ